MAAPSSLHPTRLLMVMVLVTGTMFMELIDGTIITTALPAMAQSFGTSAIELNIGVSAYLLALGIFIPASGWIADRFGTRTIFALAITLFTVSSALCGAANGFASFLAVRIVQGIAGAMMVPVGRLVVLRYTPKEKLMSALSNLVWPALVAPVLGPPLGGFITTHFGWRWLFYLNVPLGVVALAACLSVVPEVRESERRPFDLLGFLLCGAGTFALLSGLERAVAQIDLISLALIAAGIGLMVATLRHFRRATAPMLDLSAFQIPTFRVSVAGGSTMRMAVGSAPFLLPLMFQEGFGYDAFHSGLLVLAVFAGNLGMKTVTTPILRRFGFRPVMIWNGLLCVVSLAACALLRPDTPVVLTVILLVVGGMTRSMQFTTLSAIAFADVPKPRMADANGLFATVSQIAAAAGITLAALGVRAGRLIADRVDLPASGIDYRIAFLLIALLALVGLIDAMSLPRGAGDHFVERAS
jgi:EmrB/QacA subfamily drug resistance transporter